MYWLQKAKLIIQRRKFLIIKGEFAVLADDDVNFRSGPSTTADVLACLPRHSLLRLSGSKSGEWQKVEWNGKNGYIFAEYLEKPEAEELIDEDNSLGDWHLGQILTVQRQNRWEK
ncbi:MAG: SH3 domain-containing protein [Phascolarctobacterium sp.]|nr:SH3 domain-containing protein [Phascolarctobacterium sp.]